MILSHLSSIGLFLGVLFDRRYSQYYLFFNLLNVGSFKDRACYYSATLGVLLNQVIYLIILENYFINFRIVW